MRLGEGCARQAVEEIAGDRLARRERDGVHETIETIPLAAQFRKK